MSRREFPLHPGYTRLNVVEVPVTVSAFTLAMMRSGDGIDFQIMRAKARRGADARREAERVLRGVR
jgi:hypothetical protein